MARAYNVIDADGHVLEPADMWVKNIDPKFRDRAPRLFTDADGNEVFVSGDQPLTKPGGGEGEGPKRPKKLGGLGGITFQGAPEVADRTYAETERGGADPHERIKDMDAEGIDAAFVYPTLGLMLGAIKDPELSAACCRAYNRWVADYCKPYPDRLFGAALLPLASVELAIKELNYAVKELGCRSFFMRPNPYNGRRIQDPANYPLWETAQALGVPVGIHEGTSLGQPTLGEDRFDSFTNHHIVSHTMEMMAAMVAMIMCGVCSKFPSLRVGFLEAGGGWVGGWLDRMDRHYKNKVVGDLEIDELPSDIFRRQCFIAFEPVERTLALLADYVGSDRIVWASDYPHFDGFLNGPGMIRQMGLSKENEANVLAGGAKRLYGLN
jgi:predicted TIM-barrel fold metal-dependent hydrolase